MVLLDLCGGSTIPEKNLWDKVKKSSKIGQGLISGREAGH